MSVQATVVSGTVGCVVLVIVMLLAVSFDVSVGRAALQALPLALAGATIAGMLVTIDREQPA